MRLPNPFHDLPVRHRLLLSYSAVFILAIALGSIMIYSLVRRTIEANIESELSNSTAAKLNMVKTSVTVSIKNHLRAVAEKNREIVEYYFRQYKEGKGMAAEILHTQKIGQTGYIYCVDGSGVVVVHREKALMNVNVADHSFVREQMSRKEGYIEYDWKNPGDTVARPKALYMTYFQPWDWIISVSSYREEFRMLINTEDFHESILSLRFSGTGYSFIIDSKGSLIIHPKLEGRKYLETSDSVGVDDYCTIHDSERLANETLDVDKGRTAIQGFAVTGVRCGYRVSRGPALCQRRSRLATHGRSHSTFAQRRRRPANAVPLVSRC
jgi:two-component system, NtrC family, sensor kinase